MPRYFMSTMRLPEEHGVAVEVAPPKNINQLYFGYLSFEPPAGIRLIRTQTIEETVTEPEVAESALHYTSDEECEVRETVLLCLWEVP